MIRMTGLVELKPLREMGTRIPPTTEDVTGGMENMEQDQAPADDKGPVDDHEGSMAKADLLSIHKKSGELYNMIAEDEELEGWVQAKITKAAEYITAVHNNMEYEKTKPTTIGNGEMAPADPMNERTIARLQALAGIAPLTENVTEGKWYNSNEEEPTHLGQVGSWDYRQAGYDAGDAYPDDAVDPLGKPHVPDDDDSEIDIPFEEAYTLEEWMGALKEAGVNLDEVSEKTLKDYITASSKDLASRAFGTGMQLGVDSEKASDGEQIKLTPADPKVPKRMGGIQTALGKLTKKESALNESTIARLQTLAGIAPIDENATSQGDTEVVEETTLTEKAPTGWEATVKKMKKKKEIDNPWALAHWMKSRGYQPKAKNQSKE